MNIETGQTINQYKILAPIGKGGMGELFLALDTKLDRKVALKFLPSEFAGDSDRMGRFVREAKAASALNHPNIITIYEIGEAGGTHFIATEFIEGETLQSYLKNEGGSLGSILEIAIQVGSALQTAHAAGIVHRDVKPDNVMIRRDGLAKILDFGIAKLSESPKAAGEDEATAIQKPSTSPGMIIGTASYMSPEQARGKATDARSDIFSFGIVLYEMLTGRRAFDGETALESISSILKEEPEPISRYRPEVPGEIERIVGKALMKDRDERYQTANELVVDLKDAKQSLELRNLMERSIVPNDDANKTEILQVATSEDIGQTATGQTSATSPKTRYAAAGFLVLLLALGGFVGYRYFAPVRQIESIAVMPFVNESKNEEVEYLSDGMTETLIKNLSNLPNLAVKSRSTVFYYKGKETSPRKIGEELNVQAVLLGRVSQRGNDLKLNLELVNTQTQDVIWTEEYNRQQSDLVSLQSEIARDVSTKLKSKLSGADEAKVTKASTVNPEAYQAYLKGRYFWNRRSPENLQKAIEQFNLAVEKDPNYALAYVGLADSYGIAGNFPGSSIRESIPRAKAYAAKALEIDDSLGEAFATLGLVNALQWNWAEAETAYRRSIELNPNYATARQWYSRLLNTIGRKDEALAEIKRANEIDPLSMVIISNVAGFYRERGEYQTAIEQNNKILEIDPNYIAVQVTFAEIYLDQKRSAEALTAAEKARDVPISGIGVLGRAYAQLGKRDEAIAAIKTLEKGFAEGNNGAATQIAFVYVTLGDKEKTFEWLEKAFQARETDLPRFRLGTTFDPIRDDPRYIDLLKRMNLPE